jgi:rod shape-determining protein MreC
VAQLTDYLSRRGEVLVLALVVALSVALMLLSSNNKAVVARVINDAALTPVQSVLSGVDGFVGLRSENDSLRADLVRQSLRVAELAERDREASRLRELLGFRDVTPHSVVAGRVIAREPARSGRALKIDVGSRDGVNKGLAVITSDGLVGKITDVERNSSYVRPLIARDCLVSARLTRTRTDGILGWRDDLGLHLGFLPFRAEVAAGDEVVSSGLGGVFPRGIVIGHVSRSIFDKNEGAMRVLIKPAVKFSSLEEVFVVLEAREPPEPDPDVPPHVGDSSGTGEGRAAARPRG